MSPPLGSTASTTREDRLGIDAERLAALVRQVDDYVNRGELPSMQIAVARRGELVIEHTAGARDGAMYVTFSTTKAITCATAWTLLDEGKLRLDTAVADLVPGFAGDDRRVLVEHLLTHTAGLADAPFHPLDWDDPAKRAARFESWTPEHEPGASFRYHTAAGMWALAAVIEAVSGTTYRDAVRARVIVPLGLDGLLYVGLPESLGDRVETIRHVGSAASPDELRAIGLELPPAATNEEYFERYNQPAVRAVGVPGGGAVGRASGLALLFQRLLTGRRPDGERFISEALLAEVRRVRTGAMRDPMTGALASRGLGIVIAGGEDRIKRSFGFTCSAEAFGHAGVGGQLVWADPATGISFALLTNGVDRHPIRLGMRSVFLATQAASLVTRGES
jgi:CubicO group peptidase (beta-lactamase class C family)